MGSKRKIASKIVSTILSRHPNLRYVYDLFGGGGAITFEFAQLLQIERVFYNDIDTGVVELLKYVFSKKSFDPFYQWVTREEFHKHKYDPTWFGGFCKTVWSFLNDHKGGYLYGKDKEKLKKILHDIIVNSIDRTKELSSIFGFKIIMPQKKSFRDRKIEIIKQARKKNEMLTHFLNLDHLNRIELIEDIRRISFVMPIEFRNKSYEKVSIDTPIDETILYIDPPYENTSKYQNDIDHDALWDYIASSPYTIYLSSYKAPFPIVAEFEHWTGRGTGFETRLERLFCNKKN